jgi:hypothetical protein
MMFTAAFLAILISPRSASAHNGGVVVQLKNNKIVVGSDTEQPGDEPDMTARVFPSLFRPDLYGQDIPSFLSLSNAPAGTDPLPPVTNVYWDFLPMTVNGVTSNLLYWNGQGTTVASVNFGAVPQAGVTMGLYNVTDGTSALVSNTPDMVAGSLLGITEPAGSGLRMHRHNFFLLDDGDGGIPPTVVPEGIYLLAMQIRMDGYIASDPFYIVPDTFNHFSALGLDPLNAAMTWVSQRTDTLILNGDYDFDGDVDDADFAEWRGQYGSTGPFPIGGDYADGTRDGTVNAADYVFWRKYRNAGSGSGAGLSTSSVPEPSSLMLCSIVAGGVMLCVRRIRTYVAWDVPRFIY